MLTTGARTKYNKKQKDCALVVNVECMSSGTYTELLNYATKFNVPLLIHIVVCSTALKTKIMSCWTKPELENMLEDVVNELDLSEIMIEKHGPLGTAPAELVRLVLEEKDRQIRMLKAGMKQIEIT